MPISFIALKALLNTHICEVRFIRRRLKFGSPSTRKALITNCGPLLTSPIGRQVLHWRPPKGVGLKYSPDAYHLNVAWDIMWQDYRQFDGDAADLLESYPVVLNEQRDEFWNVFNETYAPLTPQQKLIYMNS